MESYRIYNYSPFRTKHSATCYYEQEAASHEDALRAMCEERWRKLGEYRDSEYGQANPAVPYDGLYLVAGRLGGAIVLEVELSWCPGFHRFHIKEV